MTKIYKLILFDFFNTIVLPDTPRIPRLEIQGRRVVTTAGILHHFLSNSFPDVKTRQVFRAMEEAGRLTRERRGPVFREITALERFHLVVDELGLIPPKKQLAEKLLVRHMRALVGGYVFPPEHLRLFGRLRTRYRLGIFSNFDHAPTLLRMVKKAGLAPWFDPIIVSDAIGFRKPGRIAFAKAIEMTGEKTDNILFVGDSLEEDVAGASAIEMDVAWLNARNAPLPPHYTPTHVLSTLPELENILMGGAEGIILGEPPQCL